LARWGQPPPPGCAPSWIPVKINPVLAKPRTQSVSATRVGCSLGSSYVQVLATGETECLRPATGGIYTVYTFIFVLTDLHIMHHKMHTEL